MENWIVRIREQGYSVNKEVFIFRRFGGKVEVVHGNGTMTTYDEGEAIENIPTIILTPGMLQSLADALAENGIKPQEGFLEGKLEATVNHLKDMRTLLKLK